MLLCIRLETNASSFKDLHFLEPQWTHERRKVNRRFAEALMSVTRVQEDWVHLSALQAEMRERHPRLFRSRSPSSGQIRTSFLFIQMLESRTVEVESDSRR